MEMQWLRPPQIEPIIEKSLELLKDSFKRFYGNNARVADNLRRAACRIDAAMYGADA